MSVPRVYLTGGDEFGWALDEDLKLLRHAISDIVHLTSIHDADVVHSVWWHGIGSIPSAQLVGKRVLCHVSGEPRRYLAMTAHRHAMGRVGHWIARSNQAQQQLKALGLDSSLVPYAVNSEVFEPLTGTDPGALRERYGVPLDRYVIANFHRDTEGNDLTRPKLVKGPDLFAAIVGELQGRGLPVHALLAGPRRHWLRQRLSALGVGFTYVGELVEEDDLRRNLLDRSVLNELYNLSDLCLVASRSEGGPHAVLEAVSARCKILCSRVGFAPELLEPQCLFDTVPQAVRLVEADIEGGMLRETVEPHQRRLMEQHGPEAVGRALVDLYARIDAVDVFAGDLPPSPKQVPTLLRRVEQKVRRIVGVPRPFTVCLWHKFFAPPYGGGNQFMLALRKALRGRGVRVVENQIGDQVDAYLLNSVQFDVEAFQRMRCRGRLPIVHRIDGPISLIRGFDRDQDDLCYAFNEELAYATVIQSAWCLENSIDLGYRPRAPVIIHNGVDGEIFHARGRRPFRLKGKVRLISSSWSSNPRKGGPLYKWLDEHLDWSRYEYTFVGRASESFDNIRQVAPVDSVRLAQTLRLHDVYITASQNDPCSNAVLEALACGLPVLYLNDGGHPELVGYGGLPFESGEELLTRLDELVADYALFRQSIAVPDLDEVAGRYLTLLREAASA